MYFIIDILQLLVMTYFLCCDDEEDTEEGEKYCACSLTFVISSQGLLK